MRRVALAIAAASAWALMTASFDLNAQAACLAATPSGAVQGLDRGASCAFLGIPFALAPTGSRRWTAPQAAAPWLPAVFDATTAPPTCPQLNSANGAPLGAEDCLKLNIWTPNPLPPSGAPVIVWLHPGAFVNASANFPGQNGEQFAAATGTIVVAANYRLGPFGFLRNAALANEGDGAGNYGFLDQRAALRWVRDHIAGFGGDPGNVTIAGQSAGAHSVALHLISPGSAGLFHRAVMESGTASFRWRTAQDADVQGQAFAGALGCSGDDAALLACLRSKTQTQVVLAQPPALAEQFSEIGRTQWTPSVDGSNIPEQPRALFERGAFARIPVLLGTTRDEGWMFVNRSFPAGLSMDQYEAALAREFGADAAAVLAAYPPQDFPSPKDALVALTGDADYVCEAVRVGGLIERAGSDVFLYSFERAIDALAGPHVVHGMDVNFVFGNNFGPPVFPLVQLGPEDLELSGAMMHYWSRFAATGKPNGGEGHAEHWPRFKHHEVGGGDKFLRLDVPIQRGRRLRESACGFWEPYFFRSVTGAVPAATP